LDSAALIWVLIMYLKALDCRPSRIYWRGQFAKLVARLLDRRHRHGQSVCPATSLWALKNSALDLAAPECQLGQTAASQWPTYSSALTLLSNHDDNRLRVAHTARASRRRPHSRDSDSGCGSTVVVAAQKFWQVISSGHPACQKVPPVSAGFWSWPHGCWIVRRTASDPEGLERMRCSVLRSGHARARTAIVWPQTLVAPQAIRPLRRYTAEEGPHHVRPCDSRALPWLSAARGGGQIRPPERPPRMPSAV